MATKNNNYDYPADGSDSILPTPGNIARLTDAERAEQAKGWRQVRAAAGLGSVITPEQIEPIQPELPNEVVSLTDEQSMGNFKRDVARHSQGQIRGH